MSEYIEQNPPFPLLQDKLNVLIKQFYEAEFEGDQEKANQLKSQIDSIEFKMVLGEKYELPF